jgi:hypothetical protein
VKTEGTQLVTVFAVFPLVILFFCARCFTRIYNLRMGAMQESRGAQRLNNGGGGGSDELVNSDFPPLSPYIASW